YLQILFDLTKAVDNFYDYHKNYQQTVLDPKVYRTYLLNIFSYICTTRSHWDLSQRTFWNKIVFESGGKHLTAKIVHNSGRVVVSASTRETAVVEVLLCDRLHSRVVFKPLCRLKTTKTIDHSVRSL
ncbi:unnamed protein product, partial [Oppiella nova]